jgi:hypothetical protein
MKITSGLLDAAPSTPLAAIVAAPTARDRETVTHDGTENPGRRAAFGRSANVLSLPEVAALSPPEGAAG